MTNVYISELNGILVISESLIVGSLRQALHAARSAANKLEFDTEIVTDKLQGETREAAKYLAEISLLVKKSHKGIRPRCLLSGGETVVTVKGDGMGGRNQELGPGLCPGNRGD